MDLREEFLRYLRQSDRCASFYRYMKKEHLTSMLEFYFACDALKILIDQGRKAEFLIEVIYKHYLQSNRCSLANEIFLLIEQRRKKRLFNAQFYDEAQEYIFQYMLQMCYPKFLVEQRTFSSSSRLLIDDESSAVLDRQIAKTIDDADQCLFNQQSKVPRKIDVIWYPSLNSSNALLSTIPFGSRPMTFRRFRQLFKKTTSYRYFFKTICSIDIHEDQYVYRELTMDDEIVPIFDGKIFLQLDRLNCRDFV